jgi:hypothetical protein
MLRLRLLVDSFYGEVLAFSACLAGLTEKTVEHSSCTESRFNCEAIDEESIRAVILH